MEVAGRHVDETVVGASADDILSQVKARVAKEMGWKGLFVSAMSPLQFAQEGVRRFNSSTNSTYALPQTADEFVQLGTDLGYLTVLPDES